MAMAYLADAGVDAVSGLPSLPCFDRDDHALETVLGLCRDGRSMVTSSIGRLFDAVAALCGVGGLGHDSGAMSYEGQAAIGLEYLASQGRAGVHLGYPWQIDDGGPTVIDAASVLRAIVDDLSRNCPRAEVAARFHRSVADLVVELCRRQRALDGLSVAALTGGVFQNRLLVELTVPPLESHGFIVLRHSQVPSNDGGISLGQVAIGRAHLAGGEHSFPGPAVGYYGSKREDVT
jgi:hydrogenase maturation protein HypF